MIEQRITLRYDAQQIPAIVQAVQGDTGRDVIFELADYEIPAGATANYYIDKPDGNAVYNSAEVISSTEILAHLTEQALAAPGRNNGQVRILADGEVITSFDFVLEVEVFRGLMRMQSETEVNIFDEALQAAAEEAIQEILDQTPVVTGMQNSIAPSYSSSSTYAVGDYVMYNAQLYKCVTAITTPEAWTASHWENISLSDDVYQLKIQSDIFIDKQIKYVINSTGEVVQSASNDYVVSKKIEIEGNKDYYITTSCNYGNGLYVITDENNDVLYLYSSNSGRNITTLNAQKIPLPEGAKYIQIGGLVSHDMILHAESKPYVFPYIYGETIDIAENEKTIIVSDNVTSANDRKYKTSQVAVNEYEKYLFFGSNNFGNGIFVVKDSSDNTLISYYVAPGSTETPNVLPLEIVIPAGGTTLLLGWCSDYVRLFKTSTESLYSYITESNADRIACKMTLSASRIDENGAIQSASNPVYNVILIPVNAGDRYLITTSCNWTNGLYSIFDVNLNPIEWYSSKYGETLITIDNKQIVISQDGYLAVGVMTNQPYSIVKAGNNTAFVNKVDYKKFIPVKNELYNPFIGFNKVKDIINAADLPSDDWRKVYPGLGYDVIFDAATNKYVMFYAAYNGTITQIGKMTSSDLLDWTQDDNNPILSPSGIEGDPDKGGMTFPQILKFGNTWIMYYVALTETGFERGVHSIAYATSADLETWTKQGILFGTEIFDPSEQIAVLYRPNVRCYFGKYYMFINAGKADAAPGGESEDIYVMQSDNPVSGWKCLGKCVDAKKIYSDNPYKICSDPCVVTNGDKFYMVCWSVEGIIGLYSNFDEFPMNWNYIGKLDAGTSRPLLIPTEENLYLVSNTGSADKMTLYRTAWSN